MNSSSNRGRGSRDGNRGRGASRDRMRGGARGGGPSRSGSANGGSFRVGGSSKSGSSRGRGSTRGNSSRGRGSAMGGSSRGGGSARGVSSRGGGSPRGGSSRGGGSTRAGCFQGGGSTRGGPSQGRGRGSYPRSYNKLQNFGFKNLESMAEKDPDTLVLDMTSDKCLPATENLVSDVEMDDQKVVLVLKVFAKACECSTTQGSLVKLLNILPKSVYMSSRLSNYLNRMAYSSDLDIQEKENQLRMMVKVFTELLTRLPSSFADLPIPQLVHATTQLDSKEELCDRKILSAVEGLGALKDEMAEKIKQEDEEKSKRHMRWNHRDKAALLDNDTPPDDFRLLSVVPTQGDVHTKGIPFLRRNKVDGSYDSPEHYLDVQFRLLREDFVRPLREGINELLVRMGSAKKGHLQDIRVYHNVRILYPVFTSKGLTHKISLDVSRMKHVRWENSKRLIYGSLLCLSKDNFKNFILATVENRDPKELMGLGRIEVRFLDTSIKILDKSSYEMVETTAYFEAYRHVLEGLKEIDPQRIPFKRYIVECKPDVRPPAYLRNRQREAVTYDLTPIMKKYSRNPLKAIRHLSLAERKGKSVHILDMNSWPSAEDLQLDESQLKAVQLALTSEFALIQGPPGTGKTYIGLKVVKVLLQNKEKWMTGTENDFDLSDEEEEEIDCSPRLSANRLTAASHPILVVCYTNHALDQFLEGIHEFHPDGIVRVGGRSQSEIMQNCSLKERRYQMRKNKKVPKNVHNAINEHQRELEKISGQMEVATGNLQKCMEKLVHEKELLDGSHMSVDLYNQLTTAPDTGMRIHETMMCYWLGLMNDDPFDSSIFTRPIAKFPFTQAAKRINLCDHNHVAHMSKVKPAAGQDGSDMGSYELEGTRNSYISIPNMVNGFLDTYQSMTIVLFIYPMSPEGGPIVCFQHQGIIGIQISQNGELDGKGVLEAAFHSRDGVEIKALSKPVLKLNQWNYIAASYDYDTGLYRLWHDGRMVQELQNVNGPMEIGSQFPVYIGSLNQKDHNVFFKGRVCGLNIFPRTIGKQQILGIAGILEEDLEDEEEIDSTGIEEEQEEVDNDTLYEAQAEQDLRFLETDEVIRFGENNGRLKTLKTVDPFENRNNAILIPNEQQFVDPNRARKNTIIEQRIKRKLSYGDMMSSQEAARVTNIWALSLKNKWRLYRYWIDQLCETYRQTVERYQDAFKQEEQRLREAKSLEDQHILKKATVIGMTTSGAARCRDLIQKIKPRITIVEEAAEVLEAHIVTSLSSGCQHVILIGDHQQLRPNPTVYKLAKDYQLDISLFERMVAIGITLERLDAQHRMRPEIAQMMSYIYDNLQNHKSVLNFPSIKGVNTNIFFIEHNKLEEFVKEGFSRSNIHEAKYLAALCKYFILQGYEREQITILTMYTGQLIQLKKEMPRDFFQGVRVCAVDNFQGEENDIILLSLVRSNEEGSIGFLRTSNRVCVALSRAKQGFYCIGNTDLMCENGDLWKNIIEDMRGKGKTGRYLTLTCQKHPKNIIHASCPADFRKAPEGGCMELCDTRLDCGHVCQSICHPGDPDHKEYKCSQKCPKKLCKDHECPKRCWQPCGKCVVSVSKEIPVCQHQQQVPCFMDPKVFHCKADCLKMMACGQHHCPKLCWMKCDEKCMKKVQKTLKCGHDNVVQCHMDVDKVKCTTEVKKALKCGHDVTVKCYMDVDKVNCMTKVKKALKCGHDVTVECYMDVENVNCMTKVEKALKCGHDVTVECYMDVDKVNCMTKVKKALKCGHDLTVECYMDVDNVNCKTKVKKALKCGHDLTVECCMDVDNVNCKTKVKKGMKCGHDVTVECYMDVDKLKCSAHCGELLKCEHVCKGTCGDCFQGRLHIPCKAKCDRPLFCGHLCKKDCTENFPPCNVPCENRCLHSKCKKKCGKPCVPCMDDCAWKCKHYECSKRCGEPCDRPRCNRVCKKLLRCGHSCIGMCGEPCPKKCRICNKDEVTEIFLGDENDSTARFVELHPCNHVIEVKAMDCYMDDVSEDNSSIQLKGCPRCKTPIRTTLRYGNIINNTLEDFEKVKAKLIVPGYKLQIESQRLQQKLLSREEISLTLLKDRDKIFKSVSTKGLTNEQLNMYENQINFLCFLSKIMSSGITEVKKHDTFSISKETLVKIACSIEALAEPLRKRIMMLKFRFSEQEKEEINDELLRLSLVTSYNILVQLANHLCERQKSTQLSLKLEHISNAINSGQRIAKDDIDQYIDEFKGLAREYGLDEFYKCITDEEKNMVVKAMGMTKGHWFKCPKGHIYCIGECGGAMEDGKCPECGSTIGGTSHALREDNTLATEMDGARHAAWSDFTNNMGNFDMDDN